MKSFFEANDIYEVLRPLLTMAFYFGLVPVRISCTKTGRKYFEATNLGLIPTVVQIATFSACFIISCQNKESIIKVFIKSSPAVFGDFVQLTVGVAGVIAVFVISAINRVKYVKSVELLVSVDRKLVTLGANLNYSKLLRRSYVVILTIFGVGAVFNVVCYVLLTQASISPSVTIFYTNFLPHLTFFIVIVYIESASNFVWLRFNIVNEVGPCNPARFLSICTQQFLLQKLSRS